MRHRVISYAVLEGDRILQVLFAHKGFLLLLPHFILLPIDLFLEGAIRVRRGFVGLGLIPVTLK
jgi:hypothetical protein